MSLPVKSDPDAQSPEKRAGDAVRDACLCTTHSLISARNSH